MSNKKKVVKKGKVKNKKVTNFTILRRRWLRGTGNGMLMNDENKMCCLGFYCRALGFEPKRIRDLGMPSSIVEDAYERNQDKTEAANKLGWLVDNFEIIDHLKEAKEYGNDFDEDFDVRYETIIEDSAEVIELVKANDSVDMSEEDREASVAALFAKQGVKVTFVG